MSSKQHDLLILGGGIVGLATAREARRRWPGARLALLEKEGRVGQHQTSHNSGVLHAGIYYKPGSLKASLCLQGMRAMKAYCAERGVPTLDCGKLIVATREEELPKLE